MTNYNEFKKDELVSMLSARDKESDIKKGLPAYKLVAKNAAYSGPLGQVFFNNGIALVEVDLEQEKELQDKIAKARKAKNEKLLHQLEEEWRETGSHIAKSLASDFDLEITAMNFEEEKEILYE